MLTVQLGVSQTDKTPVLGELKRTTPDWLRWSQNVNMCVSKQWFTSPPLSPGWTFRKRPGLVLPPLFRKPLTFYYMRSFFSHLSSLLACWHLCWLPAVWKMLPSRWWPRANRCLVSNQYLAEYQHASVTFAFRLSHVSVENVVFVFGRWSVEPGAAQADVSEWVTGQ